MWIRSPVTHAKFQYNVNHLESGFVPREMKHAIVRPLLKSPSLDPNIYKHFRPVSNLSFLSKLTERVVSNRINSHVISNELLEPTQSAYRRFHSNGTAILKIKNDIM